MDIGRNQGFARNYQKLSFWENKRKTINLTNSACWGVSNTLRRTRRIRCFFQNLKKIHQCKNFSMCAVLFQAEICCRKLANAYHLHDNTDLSCIQNRNRNMCSRGALAHETMRMLIICMPKRIWHRFLHDRKGAGDFCANQK